MLTVGGDFYASMVASPSVVAARCDYMSGDKMYCVHEAPSADVIYRHAREGGFPADNVTEVTAFIGPATAGVATV
ncbi:DUF4242 domain-containing protein (plasmid) [Rhizobium lusitanum]|nr:DUF4242 domain-containing protein [Rhizobium lusitanum]